MSACRLGHLSNSIGRVKRKRAFKHAQNMQILIILCLRKVSLWPFFSNQTFCIVANDYVSKKTEVLIRLHGIAGWSGPSQGTAVRMIKLCMLSYPKCALRRFWSDCANAQADLNLRGAHTSKKKKKKTFSDLVVTQDTGIIHYKWLLNQFTETSMNGTNTHLCDLAFSNLLI